MSTGTAGGTDNKRKLCGLVIRVSTTRQADNPEGSLKNQLQRLRAHIDYKNQACGEKWVEAEKYVLEAVSGKDSVRSREFARLFEDVRTGRINTVLCTALDRISRSVKDFLNFFEYLNRYSVEFVCLKQNYDTTTAQGRLFVTMMMALAEFEREQTSERNRDATLARAERGLWNGSQLFGYDTDTKSRGSLVPNDKEAAIVNFAFDHYLKCGSIGETAKELNRRGYRTKEYKSRRGSLHPARKFGFTSVHGMIHNLAYIGKKEINKKQRGAKDAPEAKRYRIVKAVWPAIVDEEKFIRAQKLLQANASANGNKVRTVKHNYLFNGGLIRCGKCGERMEGGSGTSRLGARYYYYACKNTVCRFRIPAGEIERVVLERLEELAKRKDILEDIVAATNIKLRKELPELKEQKTQLEKELAKVKTLADQLLGEWGNLATEENKLFLKEKLNELAKRRKELESGLEDVELTIGEIERESVSKDLVRLALSNIMDVFERANPYQQRQLLGLTLNKAVVSGNRIELALRGRPPELLATEPEKVMAQSVERSAPSDWLPGAMAERTLLWDVFEYVFEAARRRIRVIRTYRNPISLAREWAEAMQSGDFHSRRAFAKAIGVSHARISQVLGLLRLCPKALQQIEALGDPLAARVITERKLRPLVNMPKLEQKVRLRGILAQVTVPRYALVPPC